LDGKERKKLYMVWEVSSVLRKSKAVGESGEKRRGVSLESLASCDPERTVTADVIA